MGANRVKEAREKEGMPRAAFARLAEISDRTLQRLEAGTTVTEVTKNKVVNAFNRLPNKQRIYTSDFLFRKE